MKHDVVSDDSHSLMASWHSYCLYDGRINSYSSGSSYSCSIGKDN